MPVLYQMGFGNGLGMFGRHLGIESAFGIDYHYGAERAETEAARLDDEHVVEPEFLYGFFKLLNDFHGVRGCAARTAADEHLLSVPRLFCELFALFAHDAPYIDESLLFGADIIYFFDSHTSSFLL